MSLGKSLHGCVPPIQNHIGLMEAETSPIPSIELHGLRHLRAQLLRKVFGSDMARMRYPSGRKLRTEPSRPNIGSAGNFQILNLAITIDVLTQTTQRDSPRAKPDVRGSRSSVHQVTSASSPRHSDNPGDPDSDCRVEGICLRYLAGS